MPNRDIIVIGASAGGLEALRALVRGLPRDLPAALFVVWHISAESPGLLPDILQRAGELPAVNASHLEPIVPGRIYVAPPDHHLLVEKDFVLTSKGPKENRFRPAVDPLFRSAAIAYGPRVVGVILSGGLDDGTAGLWAVKQQGGVAVVQHPRDALVPSMPQNALSYVEVDYSLPIAEMSSLLVELVNAEVPEEGAVAVSDEMKMEVGIAREDNAIDAGVETLGDLSPFTCPECHGMLRELKEGDHLRFRCHTGHAYSAHSLLSEATEVIEESLWTSIRGIEESVMLLRHLAEHVGEHGFDDEASLLKKKAEEAHQRARWVRQAVMRQDQLPEELPGETRA